MKLPACCQQRAGVQHLGSFSFLQNQIVHFFYWHDYSSFSFFFFLPFGSSLPSCLWSCFLILKPVSIWPCREVAVWAPLAPSAGSCHILRSELASTAIVAPGSSEPWNFHSRLCSLSVVLERVSWFSAIPKGVQVVLPLLCVGNQSAVSGKFASAVSESKH